MRRRDFIKRGLQFAAGAWLSLVAKSSPTWAQIANAALPSLPPAVAAGQIPTRKLGKTGFSATLFGLGGEGILRTYGRFREAVPVIEEAIERGVNYFDTAPAYANSQDYYGQVFKNAPSKRDGIFLASKTHERSYEGSMKLLTDSLRRLHTDHLDLWQLHDLRTESDIDQIFSKDGAIRAVEEAKKKNLIRFVGFTGHHDPAILSAVSDRYEFDTVLVALNAADKHSLSFMQDFLPKAVDRGLGIIGMKVYSHGRILGQGLLTQEEAFRYAVSLPVSHVIIGCDNIEQVRGNAAAASAFQPLSGEEMLQLEKRTAAQDAALTYYKKPRTF
ncbi:MAG: aldo/keto reductase [Candidatus Omnitrophota bacterium]|nr:aldo/keto reductase [Candidatus Omnitrophota bacterium]